jgi:hypothetical protein
MQRWAGVVLALLAGTGIALGQAKIGLYVVDSNGARVGYPLSSSGVSIFIDGEPVAIDSGRDGFTARNFTVSFDATDCGGTGYLIEGVTGDPRPTYTAAYFTTDGILRYCLAAAVQDVVAQSSMLIHKDGSTDPCVNGVNGLIASPVITIPAPTFTPPLHAVESLQVSPAPPVATFNDVPTTHPFFQFIEALYNSGITGGCSASPPLYCPDDPLTRGQMAVFLAKALGL